MYTSTEALTETRSNVAVLIEILGSTDLLTNIIKSSQHWSLPQISLCSEDDDVLDSLVKITEGSQFCTFTILFSCALRQLCSRYGSSERTQKQKKQDYRQTSFKVDFTNN